MWFCFLTNSEFSCLAQPAKPYPVSGSIYLPEVPNQLHCIQSCAHQVPIYVYWARLISAFTIKPFSLSLKYCSFVFTPALFHCSPSLLLMF